jgi:hypothetical protein
MKYIVIEIKTKVLTRELPIAFPNMLVHKHMYDKTVELLKAYLPGATFTAVAAGDLSMFNCDLECTGQSHSLGDLKSREDIDKILFEQHDYTGGVQ